MTESAIDAEDLMKQLKEAFSTRYDDKKVVIACRYAECVEYGTTPSTRTTPAKMTTDVEDGKTVKITEARKKIRDWTAHKEGLSEKDRIIKGDRMYKYIMDHGTKPHPFIRPALSDAENMKAEDILSLIESEDPVDAYAKFLVERMKFYLKKNKSIDTSELISSIKVVSADLDIPAKDFDPDRRERI